MFEKLANMPRQYLYLLAIYVLFLIVDVAYFFLPSLSFGLYEDIYMIGFTIYSFVPLVIAALELSGKIDEEHHGYMRNVNYLLIIFFLLITAIFIVPVLVI